MLIQLFVVALASAAVFVWLALMTDRKRGAFLGQAVLVLGAAFVFLAIVAGPVAGIAPQHIAAFGVGLLSAAVSGMLYHLYLGRFTEVWAARGVFTGVYLGVSLVFGLVFLSLL